LRVHYTYVGRNADRALDRVTPFLRARLADAVDLKRVPELHFVRDV
jgi:ribosome-binding factor A